MLDAIEPKSKRLKVREKSINIELLWDDSGVTLALLVSVLLKPVPPDGARLMPGVVEPGIVPVVVPPPMFGVPPIIGLVDGVVLPPTLLPKS